MYYENKLQYVSETPNERYRSDIQSYVDRIWDNTHLIKDAKIETEIGSFIFNPIEVQKSTVSEFSVNGIKNTDDFRKLLIKDCSYNIERGILFDFDNNYWIVYKGSQEEEIYNCVIVRRCNNIAKWVDKDTGDVIEKPCVLDYEAGSFNPKTTSDYNNKPNNHTTLWIQGNSDSIKLKENQRFIFNGRPYKITGFNNYMQNDYVSKETPLLFFDIFLDTKEDDDDFDNNVANRYYYNYNIEILQNPIEQIKGFKGQLVANVKFNNKTVENPNVVWECNKNGIIDQNGNYQLIGDEGSTAIFEGSIGRQSAKVSILIKSIISNKYEIIINPMLTELKQYRNVEISANLYKNGVKQNDILNASLNGANNCYTWNKIKDNVYSLTNNQYSDELLHITFSTQDNSLTKSIEVKLKSMI